MFKEAGIHQALVDLGLEKQAILTPALQVLSPTAYRMATGASEAVARRLEPLSKHMRNLAGKLEQRAQQKTLEEIRRGVTTEAGPHPGTVMVRRSRGEPVPMSVKGLEELLGTRPLVRPKPPAVASELPAELRLVG